MRVLTIDTATAATSVGLVEDGEAIGWQIVRAEHAAQQVVAAIERTLATAGVAAADIDRVAIGCGPGSFTGLRIGVATGIGLADGLAVPACGVGTLDALRAGAGPHAVAVVDARRGEVFAAGPGVELGAYAPERLAAALADDAVLIGDGAVRHRAVLAERASVPPDESELHVPAPAALAALSSTALPASPIYVRDPDAIPTEERR